MEKGGGAKKGGPGGKGRPFPRRPRFYGRCELVKTVGRKRESQGKLKKFCAGKKTAKVSKTMLGTLCAGKQTLGSEGEVLIGEKGYESRLDGTEAADWSKGGGGEKNCPVGTRWDQVKN